MNEIDNGNECDNQEISISVRLAECKDYHILYRVFKESRWDLNFIDDIDEEQKEIIISQQFIAEKEQLKVIYPKAEFYIIMLNNIPIGRLYMNYGKWEDRVLEIGLLEEYRKRGIGSIIINRVIKKSVEAGKNVSLQVTWFNHKAYRFYEGLGFQVTENNGVTYEMKYIHKNK